MSAGPVYAWRTISPAATVGALPMASASPVEATDAKFRPMNAIICWNYLHLALLPPEQQAATLATLSLSAVLSRRHPDPRGEYDFSN